MTSAQKILPLVASALLAAGCTSLSSAFTTQDPANLTYAADAASNMKLGNEALENKNFLEAEKYFEYVRSKYPYLEAAKEAELKLADTDFDRDQFASARDKYANFVKLHPTHPQVDYAAFRAAMTHYKEIPNDYFFLPPSFEKDQTEVRNAVRAMSDFVRGYPASKYQEEAKKIVADSRRRLGEHEMYVAEFYATREKWPAVVQRLKTVVDQYAGLGLDERALLGLHEAYVKLNDDARAKEALRTLVTRLPNTPAAEKAQKLLGP
jgi:outer membrane protein assembly factor BamD